MLWFDPQAAIRIAAAVRAFPRDAVRTSALQGFTKVVIDASRVGDEEMLRRIALSFQGGDGSIAKIITGNDVQIVPADVPFAVRIALQAAQEGRTGEVTITLPVAAPGAEWKP